MRKTALALALALLPAVAVAQTFPTVPSGTVIGRTAVGTGPSQAIPFSQLLASFGTLTSITTRSVVFVGSTSGSATVSAQAVASAPTIKWPTLSGTVPTTATSPVTLDTTTGALGCATCVAGVGGGSIPISGLPTARGQIPGMASNTAASAGNVGEIVSANISFASRVAMTFQSIPNSIMQSVSITAGEWDCSGNHGFETNTSALASEYHIEISTTGNGSLVTAPNNGCTQGTHLIYIANQGQVFPNGPCRISVNSTTTVNQKNYSTWGTNAGTGNNGSGGQTMYGSLRCTRVH